MIAKKRLSTSAWSTSRRSTWVTGFTPSWSQVRATESGEPVVDVVCSQRVSPSQVKVTSSTTVAPSSARRCLAERRPRAS